MNTKRMLKKLIILICIIALMLPNIYPIANATFEDKENTSIKLGISLLHPKTDKDGNKFGYKIGKRITYRTYINNNGSADYSTYLFCLDMNGKFPSEDGTANSNYTSKGNFTVQNSKLSEENTKKILYLLKNSNLYGKFEDKIATVYAEKIEEEKESITPTTAETIKEEITDDDLFFAIQVVIWEITNNLDIKSQAVTYTIDGNVYNGQGTYENKHELIAEAIAYYRELAGKYNSTASTIPSIKETTKTTVEEGNYLYVGPFHIIGGTNNNFSVTFKNQNGDVLSGHELVDAPNSTGNKIANINTSGLNKDLYIKLPVITDVTKIKMELDVTGAQESNVALWESNVSGSQPIVSVTPKNLHEETEAIVTKKEKVYDVALRKYITEVNGEEIPETRIPSVSEQPQDAKYNKGDFKYSHRKDPVEVKIGQTVTYTFQVYNECENSVIVKGITDYLPKGLELVETENNSWTQVSGTNAIRYSADIPLDPVKIDANGKKQIDSKKITVTCKVAGDIANDTILTNVAEITSLTDTNGITVKDEDSDKPLSDETKQCKPDYKGTTGESDLTKSDYYYFGEEDDDDFEKIIVKSDIKKEEIDLALRKYISTVNGQNKDRKPNVNTEKLADGSDTTAIYEHSKTPVPVQTGDIVVYTIRVYNEGNEDAYVNKITDYIPEGLGFLVNHRINYDNGWKIATEDSKTVKLSEIANATKNISKVDFQDGSEVENQDVIVGKANIETDILKYTEGGNKNKIPAFNKTSEEPSSVFVQVACVVVAEKLDKKVLKNIAAITAEANKDGIEVNDKSNVIDRDSEPNEIDVNTYPEDRNIQDDDDYEDLTLIENKFDLALQKFITGLNNTVIKNREPKVVINEKGEITYTHTAEPLNVANKNIVTYTIRVYNEGTVKGYASVIKDDIPDGLVFLPENQINKNYMWKMYREVKESEDKTNLTVVTLGGKDYVEVTDSKDAEFIATNFYSKENCDKRKEEAMREFDSKIGVTDKNPDYRDVKVAFEVDQTKIKQEDRIIINTAEITDDQDENGNPIDDIDSIPNNDKEGEDDIDKEKIVVKYFDLSLLKFVSQVRVTEDGKTKVTNTGYDGTENPDPVVKVEINRKKLKKTSVTFIYKIKVTNEGELEGYAKEVTDYIPKGLEFHVEDNKKYNWKQNKNGSVSTDYLKNTLLKPGESATVEIALRWKKSSTNLGMKTNVAEISADYNEYNTPDIDSVPNNRKDGEDDQDDAPVILSISTGGTQIYIILIMGTISILACGMYAIKKYVLV
ncbi:MAG: DUF11 domain-containing protein [Clostridia bacterium]|nr:DUF11 domain-containing protein [Clostridia bacterium]MCI8964936.1 DUF11 domain-containing protein [Clostridia bacterium]